MITVDFKTPDFRGLFRIETLFQDAADASAREAAEYLRADIRSSWSFPPPSEVGNPPAVRTGNLDSAVVAEKQARTSLGRFSGKDGALYYVRVDTDKGKDPRGRQQYAVALEYNMGRPFMEPAAERLRNEYPKILSREFRKAAR